MQSEHHYHPHHPCSLQTSGPVYWLRARGATRNMLAPYLILNVMTESSFSKLEILPISTYFTSIKLAIKVLPFSVLSSSLCQCFIFNVRRMILHQANIRAMLPSQSRRRASAEDVPWCHRDSSAQHISNYLITATYWLTANNGKYLMPPSFAPAGNNWDIVHVGWLVQGWAGLGWAGLGWWPWPGPGWGQTNKKFNLDAGVLSPVRTCSQIVLQTQSATIQSDVELFLRRWMYSNALYRFKRTMCMDFANFSLSFFFWLLLSPSPRPQKLPNSYKKNEIWWENASNAFSNIRYHWWLDMSQPP